MADIVISKSYRAGKIVISSASPQGSKFIEDTWGINAGPVQVTIDYEGLEDVVKLIEAEGLEVDVH